MNQSEIILFKTEDGAVKIDTIFQNKTILVTKKKMAELFDVQRPAITKHLKNIFDSGELEEEVVSSILEHTTQHGAIEGKTQTKETKYYNLDVIIDVGYRVNSKRATQFRIWATAAELTESRSNPEKQNMGLTAWRGFIVRKYDVSIAQNYLVEEEIKDLNENVTMYLDYAERQARKRRTVHILCSGGGSAGILRNRKPKMARYSL